MNKKIIYTIALTSLILLVGCEEIQQERFVEDCNECTEDEDCWYSVNGSEVCMKKSIIEGIDDEITNCNECRLYKLSSDRILNKVCECYNKNNVSYTIDFNCNENTAICDGLTFETKKELAMIDDNWYCICEERVIVTKCEQTDMCSVNIYPQEVNRTTEFIWSY